MELTWKGYGIRVKPLKSCFITSREANSWAMAGSTAKTCQATLSAWGADGDGVAGCVAHPSPIPQDAVRQAPSPLARHRHGRRRQRQST
jgi:hypothetical protein